MIAFIEEIIMTEPVKLEIFSDYIWPWCYFIAGSVEKLKENHEVNVEWLAFPLHPETPEEGVTLAELFKGRNFNIDEMMQKLKV